MTTKLSSSGKIFSLLFSIFYNNHLFFFNTFLNQWYTVRIATAIGATQSGHLASLLANESKGLRVTEWRNERFLQN